ncbi:3'-5' exonuclease [Pseudoalteromonas phenolica]|uniref:3'-5' exonuclease n=1 Tax=Pseudoalteromonas phenolica TaxID=161398 RepID=UPI00110A18A8|nr:3'-5' exonuclease [Pseudoalteromonas phenolica]TMO54465.1 hypothetical protein CWC21_15170 [Pseudoalteromonas phenolica]
MFQNKSIVSIDIEGSGSSPAEIIEISVVRAYLGKVIQEKTWLIQPEGDVTDRATNIHGIRKSDLYGQPKFTEIKSELLSIVQNSILLAHNVSVEKSMLARYLPEWEPIGFIDTLKSSRYLLPNCSSYSLSELIEELKVEQFFIDKVETKSHRAKYDAYAALYLFFELLKIADNQKKPFVGYDKNVIQNSLF